MMFVKVQRGGNLLVTLRAVCLPIEEPAGHASNIITEYLCYWFYPQSLLAQQPELCQQNHLLAIDFH